tara:strand:+ start:631 stop:750 length:120 start_codon:yes stop_codon:yes gene_type:complete
MSKISICGKFTVLKKLRTGTKNNKIEVGLQILSLSVIGL